jgi:L-alanine-DL-glutamate epimerase-like enolase superfamily enzyme
MRIIDVTASRWTLPLRAPFQIATRTAYEALNVAVIVHTSAPTVTGCGASAPVAYVTGETVESVLEAIDGVKEALIGLEIGRLQPLVAAIAGPLEAAPAARAGLEIALYDAWAKSHGLPLWQFFGACSPSVATDLTIPIVTPENAAHLAAAAWTEGIRSFKVKVGHCDGPAADLERIHAVYGAAPDCKLRIDANQAFTPETAIAFIQELNAFGDAVELVEQPVDRSDVDGLRTVRTQSHLPIFADEAVCSPKDALRLIQAQAVDGINIKLMKCGVSGALDIISICRTAGIPLMIGCMLESGVGISAAACLAAGTGAFQYIDLDSHRLLAPIEGLTHGFASEGDRLVVLRDGAGWGSEL